MIIGDFTRACGILDDVLEERKRQERLVDAGKFKETCAGPSMTDAERLAVLTEELGEVAECVVEARWPRDMTVEDARYFMRKELVQVAAVAVAWIEAIDQERPL